MDASKRNFLKLGGVAMAATTVPAGSAYGQVPSVAGLDLPTFDPVEPISNEEFEGRVAKAQGLMQSLDINAMVLEPGASFMYFSGAFWFLSERLTTVVIPREGTPFVVTPMLEEQVVPAFLKIEADVHTWLEHEDPYVLLADILRERGLSSGKIAFEETVRFFVSTNIMNQLPDMVPVSGDPVARTLRRIKSPAELKLMHRSQAITLAAYQVAYDALEPGMTGAELTAITKSVQAALGGQNFVGLGLVDAEAAKPHGLDDTTVIGKNATVLMDIGCTYEGYYSDVSRTFFVGRPSKKQVDTWNLVRQGLDIVAASSQIGNSASLPDDNVRAFYESKGFGPDYQLPGLVYRAGHGIGMDIHEEIYLVRGNETPFAPGMCFSNEPVLYTPGEFGVRLEDIMYMTNSGPKYFTTPPENWENPLGEVAPLSLDL